MNTMRISLFSINIRKATTWLFLVSVLFAVSCQKNNYSVDLDEVKQAPTAAQFVLLDNKLRVDYFVRNVNAPYKIPVGFTNVTKEDRKINFVYTSRNAAPGVQFNGPASIVIPAGKVLDTLSFNGIFSGYPTGRKDTIKIKFSGVQGVDSRDSFELILQRYCDVDISALLGEYANTYEYSAANVLQYGPYLTGVDNLVATGPTKAEGYFVNLYDEGWTDIKFIMDWSNPASFTITIPEQPTGSAGSSVKFIRSTPGRTNTFSSCDGTFSISIDRLNASKQLLGSAGYQIRLAR